MTKQLFIGLALGAACTGLVFLLFAGSEVSIPTVSDAGDLKLLAQVIPNEPETSEQSADSSDVIEVRLAPAVAPTLELVESDPEVVEDDEEEVAAEEVMWCAYLTDDEPEEDGIINEVAWMGSDGDASAEWIEVRNNTRGELDMSGWQLVDKAQQIRTRVPDGVVLPKNGLIVFERDEHRLPGTTVLYKGALGNTDEGLRLYSADCGLQDEVVAKSKWPAGTNSPKHTAERAKDLSWHTYYGSADAGIFGTPGERNSDGPPEEPEPEPEEEPEPTPEPEPEPEPEIPAPVVVAAGQLIISEVMAGSASGGGDEFIELYNATGAEIDLTGFSIKKKVLSSGNESSLVTTVNFEGKKVAAGERFVIGHGAYTDISQMNWPTSYSLAYTGNAALLYNAQSEKIDEVTWELSVGQSHACESQGSCVNQEVPNPGI